MSDVQTAEQLWVKAHELVKAGQLAHAVRDLARCYEILKAAQDPRLSQVHRRWIEVHQVYLRRSQKAKKAKESAAQASASAPSDGHGDTLAPGAQQSADNEAQSAAVEVPAVVAAQAEAEPRVDPVAESQSDVPVSEDAQESEPAGAPSFSTDTPAANETPASADSPATGHDDSWQGESPESAGGPELQAADFDEATIAGPQVDAVAAVETDAVSGAQAQALTLEEGDSGAAFSESSETSPLAADIPVFAEETVSAANVDAAVEAEPSYAVASETGGFFEPTTSSAPADVYPDEETEERSAAAFATEPAAGENIEPISGAFFEPTTSTDSAGVELAAASYDISAESGAMPVDAPTSGSALSDGYAEPIPAVPGAGGGQDFPNPEPNAPALASPATDFVGSPQPNFAAPSETSFPVQMTEDAAESFSVAPSTEQRSSTAGMDDVAFLEALLQRVESRRRAADSH